MMIKLNKILVSITFLLLLKTVPSAAQLPRWEWAKRYGGSEGIKQGWSITIDENNNLYVAGSFYDDFTIEDTKLTSVGQNDIFIAKFNEAGDLIWVRQAGGEVHDEAYSVSINKDNLYITGYFNFEAAFEDTVVSLDGANIFFIAKYDINGNFIWVNAEGNYGLNDGYSITSDNNDNIYVTGRFYDTTFFQKDTNLISSGKSDIFIAKYNVNGDLIWAKQAGGTSFDEGRFITTDNNDDIYVTGEFRDTAYFDTAVLITDEHFNVFLSKYNSAGNLLWIKHIESNAHCYSRSIATDNNNFVYIPGSFRDTINFNDTLPDGNEAILTSKENYDIFIAKYDTIGNLLWIKQIGDDYYNGGNYIITDSEDNFYLVGNFKEAISIGDTLLTCYSPDESSVNVFIAKFDNNGNFIWAKKIGSYIDGVGGIITDSDNNVYVTGYVIYTTVNLDGIILPPVGAADFFLAKIAENPAIIPGINNQFFVKIFPNPVTDKSIFKIEGLRDSLIKLEIFNLIGIQLYSKNLDKEYSAEICRDKFKPGLYLYKVSSQNRILKTGKFVVQ